MAFLAHLGALRPLRPVGPLGPFWASSNDAKRGQGGSPSSPKPQVGPPEPVLAPKWLKTTSGPLFSPWPLEITRGHQLSSKERFPSVSGEEFSFLNTPPTQGSRSGAYMV
ncbi:hypothetical protein O181_031799 [Austropuccinia psidii MF-1]|uniref:Uncharacterized protein n=1 Tax=Austropuccinia psidii MF-1 TaxID=1389203 RepID=A0A9Q3H6Y0_9BASI|nr:hypothetical protein [Austropuccinia psidii MF-1]